MSKCTGCGAKLQNKNNSEIGYTTNLDNKLCERCFRIVNYNEYRKVFKSNESYIKLLNEIGALDELVILVVDMFNISYNLEEMSKYINNNILLVLNKRDILPKSLYDENIKNYFKTNSLNIIDTVIISSTKNIGFDELYYKINKYKKSNNVYVVGFTNSGKSSMINKIIYNYSDKEYKITTSNLPNTTIDSITVEVNDTLTLIDTPGLLDDKDIINFIDPRDIKKIIPKREIKPITYQIKTDQSIIIEDLVRIDVKKPNSLIFYISNDLDIKRYYRDKDELKNLKIYNFKVPENSDIVIQGLGFVHVIAKCEIKIYAIEGVRVFIRKSLV